MFDRSPHLLRSYSYRLALLLTVFTSLFAESLYPFNLDHSRLTTASPLFADCVAPCFETFDNVTAPALPSGWTATKSSSQKGDPFWETVNDVSDSAPNSAFVSGPSHIVDNRLTSRHIGTSTSGSVLTFRRQNNLELNGDGMVLEISIDGEAFKDIITAGGSFVTGGYTGPISKSVLSPIGGRNAWTGNSNGFVTTSVNLPAFSSRETLIFRWRVVTDESIASPGVFIDSITLTNLVEPPANDNFANAQPILGSSGVIQGSNIGATREANEPNHANTTGTASVWFRWQAPSDGNYSFTTFGSASDTLLAVYTGNSLPGTPIASNNNDPLSCFFGEGHSGVAFDAIGGTVYQIAVDKQTFSIGGNVRLRWGRSATITGSITDASLRPMQADTVQLSTDGGCYRKSEVAITFRNIPAGFNYSLTVLSGFSGLFAPRPGIPSISPLIGSVSGVSYYRVTPAHNISGTVSMPSSDTTGIAVTCVSTPGALVSRTGSDLGAGKYQCPGMPTGADYIVTPAKLGYSFTPAIRNINNLTFDAGLVDFTGSVAPTRTISGQIKNQSGTGVSGISVGLSGSQAATKVTDANGNYSFTEVLHGGNYTVTPANPNVSFTPPSISFTNLVADQTANFTVTFLLQLILDDAGQVAAVDSSLVLRDPFPVISNNLLNSGVDRNTRVTIFLWNFQLNTGESAASVVINLTGSNNQSYDVPAEEVRPVSDEFTQVTFRLPDTLAAGTCTLAVKAHGLTSNMGSLKISN